MVTIPLIDILNNDSFKWMKQAQKAFVDLKNALVSTPDLTLPDFQKEFVVEIDAFGSGIRTILL